MGAGYGIMWPGEKYNSILPDWYRNKNNINLIVCPAEIRLLSCIRKVIRYLQVGGLFSSLSSPIKKKYFQSRF